MKKKELFAISLLSILVFVSFANVAVAAPPGYVGVKKGETYIWRANLNMANLNNTAKDLFGADNWTLMYEMFMEYFENITGTEFDFLKGAGIKVVLTNVTDEMPHPWMTGFDASGISFDEYVSYAANNWTLVYNSTMYPEPLIWLFDPNDLNESTIMMGMSGTPLIMSKGFNYAMFVSEYQSIIASNPYTSGNITITVQGNGFKIVYKAAILEYLFEGAPFEVGTMKDAEVTCRWNSNGVLDKATLKYDGVELATAYLETEEVVWIPGYELVTILGVSLVTFIALVYTIKKKKILK